MDDVVFIRYDGKLRWPDVVMDRSRWTRLAPCFADERSLPHDADSDAILTMPSQAVLSCVNPNDLN